MVNASSRISLSPGVPSPFTKAQTHASSRDGFAHCGGAWPNEPRFSKMSSAARTMGLSGDVVLLRTKSWGIPNLKNVFFLLVGEKTTQTCSADAGPNHKETSQDVGLLTWMVFHFGPPNPSTTRSLEGHGCASDKLCWSTHLQTSLRILGHLTGNH